MPPKASSSKATTSANTPLPLNAFLQHLVANGLSMANAIKVASPMLKQRIDSPSKVAGLNEAALTHLNITDKELRKQLLAIGKKGKKGLKQPDGTTKPSKKRGRDADLDEGLPDQVQPAKKLALDINEELDDFTLSTKSVIVNRAPVMTAWSFVVAERLSFNREEALSLAQAYTEANAISKGVSLGIMSSPGKSETAGSAQPFIELMGRKVPMISMQDGQWRGMVSGAMADPERAFSSKMLQIKDMQRSFRQQLGSAVGAMRLLANSFTPKELNEKGYVYIEFRPQGQGWGERSELKFENILNLRRFLTHKNDKTYVKKEDDDELFIPPMLKETLVEPALKKPKLEEDIKDEVTNSSGGLLDEEDEYDRFLDDDLDLSTIEV